MSNLIHLLHRQAQVRPGDVALVEGSGRKRTTCTFQELDRRSAHAAARLRASGLRSGDVVLVAQPVSIDLYVLVAAILRAGLVAMIPDASAGRDRLAEACREIQPSAVAGPARAHLLRLLLPEVRRIPHAFTTGRCPLPGTTRLHGGRPGPSPIRRVSSDAPALITFTSGSTGTPKAIARSHGLLRHQYEALRDALDLQAGQVDLSALPVFVLANLAAGVTTVLPDADLRAPGRISPEPVLAQLRRERPTRLTASPAFIECLLGGENPDDAFASLKRIDTGGAPVPLSLQDRIAQTAPHAEISVVYGSSEAEPIAHVRRSALRPADRQQMRSAGGLLVGSPVSQVDVRILPDPWNAPSGPLSHRDFEAAALPHGHAGEIVVSGDHVVPSYLGATSSPNKVCVDGTTWHRTGDAGRLDAHGRLWLLGRCSARIDRPNQPAVYPFPIECAAQSVPGVRRAAALSHQGQLAVAVEAGSSSDRIPQSLSADEALAHAVLNRVRAAEAVFVLPEIPVDRRHNAKVDYPRLREGMASTSPAARRSPERSEARTRIGPAASLERSPALGALPPSPPRTRHGESAEHRT